MEISKWQRRKYVPAWGDNREESDPCEVVYKPPTVGWMARWKGLAMQAPGLVQKVEEDPEALQAWEVEVDEFRSEMLRELVVAINGLTADGVQMSVGDGVSFILDNRGLLEEVFSEVVRAGGLGGDRGKD